METLTKKISIIDAQRKDKTQIINVLCVAFKNDPQINYILGDTQNKEKRLRRLMSYSFEYSMLNGDVKLSEDKKSVALWKDKSSHRMSFRMLIENILFLFEFGFKQIKIIEEMEKMIEANYLTNDDIYYLWTIGTLPETQGKGYASALIDAGIEKAKTQGKIVYLETSTQMNLIYYQNRGFEWYHQMDLNSSIPTTIYFLKQAN
jgi:ribosomal protein S18 acetylase RimI-like enzyme